MPLKIGDIKKISIEKLNRHYSVLDVCENVRECNADKNITELSRYQINSITLVVNNKVIYSNHDVGHVFGYSVDPTDDKNLHLTTGLIWKDESLQINSDYIRAMQREDCGGI